MGWPVTNHPARETVERIASEEAALAGVSCAAVLGVSPSPRVVSARKAAWRRILAETGCSILGLATVWGCDRRSIQRGMSRTEAA